MMMSTTASLLAVRRVVLRQQCQRLSSSQQVKEQFQTPQQIKLDHAHCVDLVQQRDREGYLCGLLIPSHARKSYFAVRAYNVELASMKDASGGVERRRPPSSGEGSSSLGLKMRMQWWREALHEIYGSNSSTHDHAGPSAAGFLAHTYAASHWHNPVVRELHRAVEDAQLTKRFLERLLVARETDLELPQMPTVDDLIDYSEATSSSLLYLSLECAGVRDEKADQVASNLGVGMGLINALRSTAYRASIGELSLPADLMKRHGVDESRSLLQRPPEESLSETQQESLRQAAEELAQLASGYLSHARSRQSEVPRKATPCLLPAVSSLHYLEQLREANYNVLDPQLNNAEQSRFRLLMLLGRTWLTGVF